ncbi:MAG: thioredoxin-dependent thiol peroxidase [Acidimicrobiia bacterium]|nr:thioredoxin-dependent thiol peroxidase [Acidimicrobiia bacterium]MBT8246878.1 thioredoxin-dependent thiol peroxidase [Acidimicrobiia bacterium]NNF88417.1 thioredoxin-dependent thiol peroxidase [Acidimicrobiia bacterium]NNJ48079.1 thioredoxin-dependent thiol peroxidase [Acidimicrobiia bacterium]
MKLESGNPAPAFARRDQSGAVVTNADLSGKKAIIYFYPKAFTPGCTTQSCDFRDNYQAFQKAGYEILGVSPDPVEKLESFREEYDLPFPLLSDEDHSMAEAFGAWGTQTNYGKEYVGLIRSTFALDEAGAVSHAWYNVKAKGNAERVGSEVLE